MFQLGQRFGTFCRRLLEKAHAEWDRGDAVQASEKAWDAAGDGQKAEVLMAKAKMKIELHAISQPNG